MWHLKLEQKRRLFFFLHLWLVQQMVKCSYWPISRQFSWAYKVLFTCLASVLHMIAECCSHDWQVLFTWLASVIHMIGKCCSHDWQMVKCDQSAGSSHGVKKFYLTWKFTLTGKCCFVCLSADYSIILYILTKCKIFLFFCKM